MRPINFRDVGPDTFSELIKDKLKSYKDAEKEVRYVEDKVELLDTILDEYQYNIMLMELETPRPSRTGLFYYMSIKPNGSHNVGYYNNALTEYINNLESSHALIIAMETAFRGLHNSHNMPAFQNTVFVVDNMFYFLCDPYGIQDVYVDMSQFDAWFPLKTKGHVSIYMTDLDADTAGKWHECWKPMMSADINDLNKNNGPLNTILEMQSHLLINKKYGET